VKTNKSTASSSRAAIVVAVMLIVCIPQISTAAKPPEGNVTSSSPWSVQVDATNAGEVTIEPAFQIAIYENLLREVTKTKSFDQVFRSGDRNANSVPNLLILKTTVEKYTPGSETRRAVTTVSGATKLSVRSQLCTRAGQIVWEQVVDGNVRFIGGNLRATNNLARNVAKEIRRSSLPQAAVPSGGQSDDKSTVVVVPAPFE
jgi:hypothetical protein